MKIVTDCAADMHASELEELGITGMTVTEVRGFGRQKGRTETGLISQGL